MATEEQPHWATAQRKKRSRRSDTLRLLVNEFNDYGHRTTVHGLGHMYQSTDSRRKVFWLCITMVSLAACSVHIYFIVSNFMETPVNSLILQGRIRQEFPDVTLCNMYPISESVQFHAAEEIHEHISQHWGYFSGFIKDDAYFQQNTTVGRFKAARKFMQIFWASEDTRDLAHDDDIFIVNCKYKSRDCSKKQFKMIQNLDYWNCYTFAPVFEQGGEDRQVFSSNEDEGLNLILYTNTHLKRLHSSNGLTKISGQFVKDEGDQRHGGNQADFLEHYLEKYNLSLNQLLAGDKLEPDGMRIILHERDTYPHMDMNSVIVGNGDFSNIYFSMDRKISKNRPEHPCREHKNSREDFIKYMTYYPGSDVKLERPKPPNFKRFKRSRLDYVVEESQNLFWSTCNCYTHIMPFKMFNSMLCYYCRNGTDPAEIAATLKNIKCHDDVYEVKLKRKILDYFRQSQSFQPCSVNHYNVKMGSSVWPGQRDIKFLFNQFVIRAFQHESVGGKSYNHILRSTKVRPITDIISVEGSVASSPLNWSVNEYLVRKNFLKVAIHADSPTGTLHEEVESYSFAEALSEIGGIFGLYAGVSILSFFEFIELLFLMSTKPNDAKRRGGADAGGRQQQQPHARPSVTAMLQQAVDAGEVSQADLVKYRGILDYYGVAVTGSGQAAAELTQPLPPPVSFSEELPPVSFSEELPPVSFSEELPPSHPEKETVIGPIPEAAGLAFVA